MYVATIDILINFFYVQRNLKANYRFKGIKNHYGYDTEMYLNQLTALKLKTNVFENEICVLFALFDLLVKSHLILFLFEPRFQDYWKSGQLKIGCRLYQSDG